MSQTERTRKGETGISLKKWLPSCSFPPALGTSMSSESLSRVRLFETPWAVARQAPVSKESQARILERVAIAFSKGSSQPRDRTRIS